MTSITFRHLGGVTVELNEMLQYIIGVHGCLGMKSYLLSLRYSQSWRLAILCRRATHLRLIHRG